MGTEAGRMPDRGEFRATTDQLLAIIDRLRATELAKRDAELGSPEFVALARSAAEDGRLAYRWTEMQLTMAEQAAARLARGELANDVRLTDVQPRPIDRILSLWREAQLRLEIARPGSAEAQAAADDAERLREEYAIAAAALEETARALARGPLSSNDDRTG
jgi:hypothetical protein